MLLTNTQISRLPKAIPNGSSANIKLSKTQLHKIEKPEGLFGRLLLKAGLPVIRNILKPLAKRILISLGLAAAAASVIDADIHKNMFGSARPSDVTSRNTTLIISNEEMNGITKISLLKNLFY